MLETSLGTSAGFAGQGAFATLSTAAYGSSLLTGFSSMATRAKVSLGDGFVFKADGITSLTDAIAVTSLGTAAAFVGQGSLATKGTVTYGTADVTGFGAMAARTKVSLSDGFVFRADGTTALSDAITVTSLGTAAGFIGQGALATKSSVAPADMVVGSLSAITATIGTLRTATTGARTEIADNLITVYDSGNVLRVRLGVW